MKPVIALLMVAISLAGCAVKPVTSTQTIQSIDIRLSKPDKQVYRLVDQRRRVVANSNGANAQLNFSLPPSRYLLQQCLTVTDARGKVFAALQNIKPTLAITYHNTRREYAENTRRVRYLTYTRQRTEQQRIAAIRQLKTNRAFVRDRCILPEQRYLPARPRTKCDSEHQCKEEGGAICYTMVFRNATACSIAASELKLSGMLTSPACGALAAKMAKEKYGMGDLVADAILGGIEDSAKENWNKGEYGAAVLLGAIAVGGKYLQARNCTENFVERHYGPLREWLKLKYYIEREPYQSKRTCEVLVTTANRSLRNNEQISKQLEAALETQKRLGQDMTKLRTTSQEIAFCK